MEEDTKTLIFICKQASIFMSNMFVFFGFYLQKTLNFICKKILGLYMYQWVTFFFTTQKLNFFFQCSTFIFFSPLTLAKVIFRVSGLGLALVVYV